MTTIDLLPLAEPAVVSFDDVAIQLHPDDDVAIAKVNLAAGTILQISRGSEPLRVSALIPSGHKFAIREVKQGRPVRRYGQVIGFATRDIAVGDHVHVHNLAVVVEKRDRTSLQTRFDQDYAFGADVRPVVFVPEDQRRQFMGYRRADGRVGTRNYIAVIATVNCSAHTVRRIAHHFTAELLANFPNVDGVIAIAHGFGCATRVGGEDYVLLQRTLAGIAAHPNVGGYVLVGLGCEVNQISALVENYHLAAKEAPRLINHQSPISNLQSPLPPPSLTIQDTGGVRKTIEAGIAVVKELLPVVNQYKREPTPISELTVALQCGGSDGWSGVTANPVLGMVSDEIVRQGGRVVLAETPEIYGAEHLLTRRAISREVGEKLIRKIHWWEQHAAKHGVEIDNNPSHGNKAGGLTTIYEKSLGAVAKAGTTPLVDVVDYAEPITQRGFTFMDTPGYDPVGATGQVAGGCNLIVFTTGRGSCFGFKPAPSIKVVSNSATYRRMEEDMDINAGKVLEGVPMQTVADELLDYMIEVASGKPSKSEAQGIGEEEFQPWNLGGIL
ncbi:MAG: altronate dehydratase family protein [Anaerolineae bacterium]|nr:altronate dehydratase family protein [Candidatus Roseilinea sp.]MDW8451249.1 altronate dehydratase family protein [Anaerolineae bacterium]